MNVETAIKRIIDNWDDWEAEAGSQAQIEQDSRAGDFVMESRLRSVLEKLVEPQAWQPADTAPFNESVLVFVPNLEHYGPGIYKAIRVNMGTGIRWLSTAYATGRDFTGDTQPTHWMPLPEPPQVQREFAT